LQALDEAYGYFQPDDPSRSQTAAALGFLLGTKHGAHGGSDQERDRGIRLIEESLEFAGLPPVLGDMGRVMLGQLYLGRALVGFQSHDFVMSLMRGGAPTAVAAELARSVGHLRTALATTRLPDVARSARGLLSITEALETMLGGFGGQSGFDLGALATAVGSLQDLQRTGLGVSLPGMEFPGMGSVPGEFAQRLADLGPLEWPVAMAGGPEPVEDQMPPVRPAPLDVDVDAMRRELRKMLPGDGEADEAVIPLLRSEGPPEGIDDIVSLAASIVSSGDGVTGTDHLVLAAALHLRSRRDEGGWAESDDDTVGGDAEAAVASLLTAAETLPAEDLGSVPVLVFLASLLSEEALADLAGRLTDVTAVVRTVGADAVVFPEPAAALRLNARTGRIESATAAVGGESAGIVVVGDEPLELADDPVVSHVASLSQLRDLSRREVRPVTQDPVFLVNPRGDRESAAVEAMSVRRSFYPHSTGLGVLIEDTDGTGTVDEVRGRLDASLLHLSCGVTAGGALELAGSAELDLAGVTVPRGGVVVLPPGCYQPLADILLEVGFTGVIGWAHPIPEETAALMLFVLHRELVDHGRPPAEAVREVRRWLRDPECGSMPSLLAGYARHLDEGRALARTAMVYRGR
jgi:hypothetical protein